MIKKFKKLDIDAGLKNVQFELALFQKSHFENRHFTTKKYLTHKKYLEKM